MQIDTMPAGSRVVRLIVACCSSALLLAPALSGSASAAQIGWRFNGPHGAIIRDVAVAASDPSRVYASSPEHVYRTDDGGASWVAMDAGLSSPVLAVSGQDPNIVYAATWGSVEKSVDGGATWTVITNGLPDPPYTDDLAVDPTNDRVVYSAGLYNVYKTTDGGANWSLSFNLGESTIAIDPTSPSVVFAGNNFGGLYKTVDGGANWIRSDDGLPGGPDTISIDPSDDQRVYATVEGGVYRSLDGGASWMPSGHGLGNADAYSLAVPATEPGTVYAATLSPRDSASPQGVFRSTDGGDTWERTSAAVTAVVLAPDPTTPGVLYSATGSDFGIMKSSDGGSRWAQADQGILETDIEALAADPAHPLVAYASTWASSGVYKTRNAGLSWKPSGFGLSRITISLAVAPSDSRVVYAGELRGPYDDIDAGVYRSVDGGSTWHRANAGIGDSLWVASLAVDPRDPMSVYAAEASCFDDECNGGGIWKTADGGVTWTELAGGLENSAYQSVALAPSDPSTLYAAAETYGSVYRTTDGGASWTVASNGLDSALIGDLAVDPEDPAIVYAAGGGPIYRSTDSGDHWTPLGPGSPNNVFTLEADRTTPGNLCAGEYTHGVWCSTDFGATWTRVPRSDGDITQLQMGAGRTLYAGTGGRGVAVHRL